MASTKLFASHRGPAIPVARELNEAGGRAYALSPRHALAQYAATGCLSDTFYAGAEDQLERVLDLASQVPPEFVAQTAVFSRERGFMKDMPALLLAILTVRGPEILEATFDRVVDNERMLRNFVQIMRSGVVGLDIQPYRTVQATDRDDILNVGGFSDQVFDLIADFAAGRLASGHWVEVIEKIEL